MRRTANRFDEPRTGSACTSGATTKRVVGFTGIRSSFAKSCWVSKGVYSIGAVRAKMCTIRVAESSQMAYLSMSLAKERNGAGQPLQKLDTFEPPRELAPEPSGEA